MQRFALVVGGIAVNVVEQAEQPAIAGTWIACGPACPGWTYDGESFAPPVGNQVTPPRHISVGSFFDRFGAAKWAILADASPAVQAVVRDASVRRYIDLDNPELPAGVAILVDAGHQVDAQQIIDAPVLERERP